MNTLKELWGSRTIKLAVIQAIVGILVAIATEYEAVGVVVVIKSIADMFLRIETKKPLLDIGEEDKL